MTTPFPVARARLRYGCSLLPSLLVAGLFLVALGASPAHAQQASIQGIVADAATAQPLAGASVILERAGRQIRSVRADRNGLYQIDAIPVGDYQLHISNFGYTSVNEPITLTGGQRLTANRGLRANPLQVEGISVTPPSGGAVERDLGRQIITPRDIRRIPTPAASGDLVSYLQTMPGVVATGDRGGQLMIRGGTASENLVLMDGMLVYQPYHITGFFSAFPEDLVSSAEFYPGGFGARYSGRTSSVLDVQMRDGDRNRRSVTASVSPFLAEVSAEGPLQRKGGSLSMILSARQSLIEQTSPWLLGEKQPLGFSSYYVKLSSVDEDGSSRCSLTGMRSSDSGGLDPKDEQSRVSWTNFLMGGRCATLSGDVFIDARFGVSHLGSSAITHGASEFTSTASRLFMEGDASRSVGPVRLAFGGYAHFEDTNYDALELFSQKGSDDWTTAMGLYSELTVPIGNRIRIVPGVTTSWDPDTLLVRLEPRLRASWQPRGKEGEELSAAWGIYRQEIAGITDRRDAGSIFTFWTRTPSDAPLKAVHAQMSWEQKLGAGLSWSVDGFYRRMYNVPVTTWTPVATLQTQLSRANGRARGADARVEYRHGPFYGFVGYGYGWTLYESAQESFGVWFGEPVLSYHPGHDRRHQANALASLDLGKYRMAARWEYGSGFPFTRPFGFDELQDFRDDLPDVRGSYGQTRVLLNRPFNGRMPDVHRLDLSLERDFDLGSQQLQLQAGVINAYDRTNIFYYDVFTNRRIDQLPIAPYASLKLQPKGKGR